MTDIGPIFRALLHKRLGALIIALQIALTLAIVTNAAFSTPGYLGGPANLVVQE